MRTACSAVSVLEGGGQHGLRMGPQGGRRQGECLEHSRIFRRCGNSWSTSSGKRIYNRFGKRFVVCVGGGCVCAGESRLQKHQV